MPTNWSVFQGRWFISGIRKWLCLPMQRPAQERYRHAASRGGLFLERARAVCHVKSPCPIQCSGWDTLHRFSSSDSHRGYSRTLAICLSNQGKSTWNLVRPTLDEVNHFVALFFWSYWEERNAHIYIHFFLKWKWQCQILIGWRWLWPKSFLDKIK